MQGTFGFYNDQSNRPRNPERLFFGMLLDGGACGYMEAYADRLFSRHRIKGARLKPERLHVSLHHLGDHRRLRTKMIYGARQAAKSVSMEPFEISFRSIQSFEASPHKTGRRPLVLLGEGGDALATLFRTLGIALIGNGLKAAAAFKPHMTLSYGPQLIPVQEIEPIHLRAHSFSLIHSRLGLTQYEVIDRWPLGT